jgi:hypothetical protein
MTKASFASSTIMSVPTLATTATRMAVSVIAVTFAMASAAQAASGRTFVSGGGNDANTSMNCASTTPCRSFAAAYGVTTSGGEIIAEDSAGFGTVTITMPISIIGALFAEVSVPAGGTGITVNVPGSSPSDAVHLKNLQITGDFLGTNTGIQLTAGTLILEKSTLKFLATGMAVAANTKSDVISTDFIGNTTGISTSGTGTNFDTGSTPPPWGPTQVRISGGNAIDNKTAYLMNTPGNDQFQVFETILMSTTQPSNTAGNTTGSTSTLVACTGLVAVMSTTPPCNSLGQFGATNSNTNQVH